MSIAIALSLLIVTLTYVDCAKVLIIPGPFVSHCFEAMAVGKELLKRGHHVTLFAHLFDSTPCTSRYDVDHKTPRFKVVSPKVGDECVRKHRSYFAEFEKGLSILKLMFTVAQPIQMNLCHSAFSDQKLIKELEEDKYDLALVEGVVLMDCLASLAVHLDVPYASIATFFDWHVSGTPLQSNTFPMRIGQFTNAMTFSQRVLNTLVHYLNPAIMMFLLPSLDMSPYSDSMKGVYTADLIKDSVLFLENSDYVIDYPKAIFPNFVQVGALTARPANELPTELKNYMDNSKHGVILVTFGSILKNIDPRVIENVLSAMYRLDQNVIVKHTSDGVRANVRTMKWIPQNDVLGHRNVRLFVSHCGKNGLWESIYHGVPIICVPLATDGFTNAVKVEHYQVGSSVNVFDADVDGIYETVRKVLNDDRIRKNMKKMSAILRDRPETSPQRAASALEHVIRYGGSHMKPPSVDFVTLIYADVWIAILVVSSFIIAFNIWLCRKCCCRGTGKHKTD